MTKKNKGFSLVELMVSVAILAIVVLPLLRAFVVSAGTNAKAKNKLLATEAGQNIMETFETKSIEDLFAYFTSDESTGWFGESEHALLEKSGRTYALVSNADTSASAWYFAISGIRGFDALVTVSPNNSSTSDGGAAGDDTALNSQKIVNLASINSDHDAIYSISKSAEAVMEEIHKVSPDVEQKDVTRDIELTISHITDGGNVYTTVTAQYSFSWTEGGVTKTYPSNANIYGYSDVIFDNSPYTDRNLQHVYLFFTPWYTSVLAGGNPTDRITINNDAKEECEVYLIKQAQDSADLLTLESNYQVQVSVNETVSGSNSTTNTHLRTNFTTNLADNSVLTYSHFKLALNGVLLNETDRYRIPEDSLTAEAKEDRLYDITVELYPSGSYYKYEDCEKLSSLTGGMVN